MSTDGRSAPFSRQLYNQLPDVNLNRMRTIHKSFSKRSVAIVATSYVTDWILLIAAGLVGTLVGNMTPNMRPFYINDPNIAFPYSEKELVPAWLLLTSCGGIPIATILIVSLVFVPGATAPKGTPQSVVWRRKLWEFHVGCLGLALSLVAAWFMTSCMKNLLGKPRPDMLSRCDPDLENLAKYVISPQGLNQTAQGFGAIFQLVSPTICRSTNKYKLDDGFRSYPSGHASASAAGLIYMSLFLAGKFAVGIPFIPRKGFNTDPGMEDSKSPELTASARNKAAAPPIYLLTIVAIPFFGAITISSTRWFEFRHHGFDLLFGFFMGVTTAWFAYRYYHPAINSGAGWAWAPRNHHRAFFAGVGSYSYAVDKQHEPRWDDEATSWMQPSNQGPNNVEMGVRQRPKSEIPSVSSSEMEGGHGSTEYQPTEYQPNRYSFREENMR